MPAVTTDVVAPGVRRIAIPLPIPALKIINAYLVEGERGWALVDSGIHTPEAEKTLRDALDERGIAMKDLRRAFITHLHPDHMGMAGMLEQEGVEVLMHRPEIEKARYLWSKDYRALDGVYEFFMRHGMPADVDKQMRDDWIAMGKRVDDFHLVAIDDGAEADLGGRPARVRWTPGHTDHHAVLIDERNGVLFSGDHVLPRITSNISLYPHTRDDPLGDFLDALRRMRDLKVTRVLPAHGDPFDDLAGRVDQILAHHDARLDAVLAALDGHARDGYTTARMLFPVLRSANEERFALAETLAHLRYLERRGRVVATLDTPITWKVAA